MKTKRIKIADIVIPPWAIRTYIDDKEINDLADSLKFHGQLQPIRIYYEHEKPVLVYGFKRYLATKKVGLKEIDAIVDDVDEKQAFLKHLAENAYRSDLHPLDLAHKISRGAELGLSLSEIARGSGLTVDIVKKINSLNKLPEWFKEAVRHRTGLSYNHLYELARIVDYPFFKEVADKVISGELSTVEAIRKEIDRRLEPCESSEEAVKAGRIVPEAIAETAREKISLKDLVGTSEEKEDEEVPKRIAICSWCSKPIRRDKLSYILVHKGMCKEEAMHFMLSRNAET